MILWASEFLPVLQVHQKPRREIQPWRERCIWRRRNGHSENLQVRFQNLFICKLSIGVLALEIVYLWVCTIVKSFKCCIFPLAIAFRTHTIDGSSFSDKNNIIKSSHCFILIQSWPHIRLLVNNIMSYCEFFIKIG